MSSSFCHFTSFFSSASKPSNLDSHWHSFAVTLHQSLCALTSLYTDNFLFFLMMTSYQMSVCRPDTQAILRELAAGLGNLPKDVTILAKPALTTILELTQSSNLAHAAAIDLLKQWLTRLDSSSRVFKKCILLGIEYLADWLSWLQVPPPFIWWRVLACL